MRCGSRYNDQEPDRKEEKQPLRLSLPPNPTSRRLSTWRLPTRAVERLRRRTGSAEKHCTANTTTFPLTFSTSTRRKGVYPAAFPLPFRAELASDHSGKGKVGYRSIERREKSNSCPLFLLVRPFLHVHVLPLWPSLLHGRARDLRRVNGAARTPFQTLVRTAALGAYWQRFCPSDFAGVNCRVPPPWLCSQRALRYVRGEGVVSTALRAPFSFLQRGRNPLFGEKRASG